eukprot:5868704-Alexandrium_andersonii.AAC.1
MEDGARVVVQDDERLAVVQHREAELPHVELPEIGDFVLAVPAEALVVPGSVGSAEHDVGLKVLIVPGREGIDPVEPALQDEVGGSS